MATIIQDISICTCNIQGINNTLGCKLFDERVSKIIKQHDIVCLLETHTGDDCINVEGFHSFQNN